MILQVRIRDLLSACLICAILAGAQPTPAQDASSVTVFLPAPRTLRQHLVRATKAIEEQQFGEAVAELGALLAEEESRDDIYPDTSQDFFVGPFAQSTARLSLKGEARRLLGSMPQAARELYELQFGAEARALLDEAAASGDVAKLTEVTRKYFHTQAGYEATLLLGRLQLDRGHPLAAAMCFERLSVLPGSARFEPELSMLLASCWLYANRPDQANRALDHLRTRFPKSAVTIAGTKINELPAAADTRAWLANQFGSGRAADSRAAAQWVVFRGDSARNAPSAGGTPLPRFRWRIPTASDPTDESIIQGVQSDKIERREPLLPSLHPLALQDVVLMRTPERLLAIDFVSGKRVWEYPWWDAASDDVVLTSRPSSGTDELQVRRDRLAQRLWQDAPYGQVSSDGKSVFMLDDLRQAYSSTSSFLPGQGGMRFRNPDVPAKHNQLVALDLKRQGSLRWMVGGETGLDEPKLAGAFFLGPPLPVSGTLYVMAEVKGEIRLFAIDPETGRQEWSQQLAHVNQYTIDRDARRRLAGATPSHADGVLLCPTSAGAIVAVEVATRSLLWGYQYQPPPQSVQFGLARRQFSGRASNGNDHWQDASLTIDKGAVLVTPVDSNKLLCLDLQLTEATPRWTRVREDELAEGLYVACVHAGTAIIIAKHSVVAVLMDKDGENAWEPVELDRSAGEMPSGRGFRSGKFYYLPTTKSRLLKMDLEEGKIVAAMNTAEPLGNLICYKDQVVSHSAGSVSCFYQTEPLRKQVAARLQQSSDDPWALARQGELFLHDGKNGEALQSLRHAYRVDPEDSSVQTLLVMTYLTALRKDFASHHELADQIEPLIDLPEQKTEYLQLMGSGYHESGRLLEALEAYVKLADVQANDTNSGQAAEPFLVKVEQDWSVRLDRWIRARLGELADSGEQPISERLTKLIQMRAAAAAERDTQQLQRDVACFGFHSASSPLRLALFDRFIEAERFLEAEQLLNPLRNHPDRTLSGTATARLAKLYMVATEYETAMALYRELDTRWSDVPVYQGKSGSELSDEAQADPALQLESRRSSRWPWGEVKHSEKNAQTTDSLSRLTSIPVEQAGINSRGAMGVGFDPRFNSLMVRDGSGRALLKTNVERSQPNGVDVAQFMGHQGFIFFGTDLIAVDTFRSTLAHNERGEAVRWRLNVAPPLESWQREAGRTVPFTPHGVRLRRNFDPGSKRAITSMGPVNEHGVFYQRLKKLTCADPATGATIWSRSDLEQGATIFGDADYLFVVADGSDQATVLRASDGRLLGQRQLPAEALRWKLSNRHVLGWDEQADRYRIYLRDIWAQADVWSEDVGRGTMGDITLDGHIVLLQPNGRFVLRSMSDDRVLARTRLERDEQLAGLRVFRFGPQYLVFAETSLAEVDSQRTIRPGHQTNAALLTARLYAFDAETGRNLWPIPAVIHDHGFAVFQPSDSPAIWFVRSVTTPQTLTSPQNAARSSLLCIDRRSGRIVFEKEDIQIQPSEFNITNNVGRRTSTFNLQGHEFTLEFTDEPAPPAPPAQTGSASSLAFGDNRLAAVAGSVFKALERQTPGADPFGPPE
ncbi:MAG: hypothetical protein CMJ64_12080 [Planctomycetaceae bacterium]|nr:hypothetical protein [Planctomycetaceae bacterium]